MSTSGVTDWSLTARDIIKAAMQELALIAPGDEPDASELQDGALRLNSLLKSWAAKGGNLFRQAEVTVSTIAGNPLVTLPVGVDDVHGVRLAVSPTYERQLQAFNRSQYAVLPNKASKGAPNTFYVEKGTGGSALRLWPVSPTVQTLKVDYTRAAETITDATETVDIPQEWQEAIYVNLAVRIAPMFQAAVSPELYQRAQMLEQQLLDADRPDSYFFESAAY